MLTRAENAEAMQERLFEGDAGRRTGRGYMVNKNSLDAMTESGKILTLKTWEGGDYKYVVITDKTAEKRGNEDKVWRVSLTCEELPVLNITPVQDETAQVDKAWVQEAVQSLGPLSGLRDYGVAALEETSGEEAGEETKTEEG